jgi:hypothetical protein
MDAGSWVNAGRFAVRHPRRSLVMARKVITRLHGEHTAAGNETSLAWLEAQAQEIPPSPGESLPSCGGRPRSSVPCSVSAA